MRDIVDHRYRIEEKLAAGGFGAVYRATDLQIGRPVALKILHRELASDRSIVARFRREVAMLARLRSPNTLTLYDVGEIDGTLYFVMELLRGESLEAVFERDGALPWRRMARVARGVCSSLREAHELGIVHRDLKPANIFLETHALDSDFVKVLDFGIAKVLDTSDLVQGELTRAGQTIGTFDYMAPEQLIGGKTTVACDVFTLGAVMYEMISGERPFGVPTGPAGMLMAFLTTKPEPLTNIPPALARIIARCISTEAVDRPSVEELDDVLARLLELPLHVYPCPAGDNDVTTLVDTTVPAAHDATQLGTGLQEVRPAPRLVPAHVIIESIAASIAESIAEPEVEPRKPRLAAGTTPPDADELAPVISANPERVVSLPPAPEPRLAATIARWTLLGLSLFGIGFIGALVISTL